MYQGNRVPSLLAETHVGARRVVRCKRPVTLKGESRVRLGHAIVLADLVGLEAGGDLIDGGIRIFLLQPVEHNVMLRQSFQGKSTFVISGS